eukprot:2110748-Rhodomonas_salina.2
MTWHGGVNSHINIHGQNCETVRELLEDSSDTSRGLRGPRGASLFPKQNKTKKKTEHETPQAPCTPHRHENERAKVTFPRSDHSVPGYLVPPYAVSAPDLATKAHKLIAS